MFAKFNIIGRLEKDPDIRPLSNEGQVANIFIRTPPIFNDDGSIRSRGTAFPITIFSNYLISNIVSKLRMGEWVSVGGNLQRRSQERNGQNIWNTEMIAQEITVVNWHGSISGQETDDRRSQPSRQYTQQSNSRQASQGPRSGYAAPATARQPEPAGDFGDDDVPF